jgi:hypothetical protein
MPAKKKSIDDVAAQNARGLKELEALQGAPGLPTPGAGTPSGRLHGKFAVVVWSATSALICSDWEINYEQEFADGTAHGEYWDIPVPIKQMWTGRIQAYMKAGNPGADFGAGGWNTYMAANVLQYSAGKISGDPAVATFTGYSVAPLIANRYIFQGTAYVSRAGFNAPKGGAATQELNLRGYGAPAAGFTP